MKPQRQEGSQPQEIGGAKNAAGAQDAGSPSGAVAGAWLWLEGQPGGGSGSVPRHVCCFGACHLGSMPDRLESD